MGFARTCSVALVGVEGVVVEVQADLEPGVAAFTLVGLPDKSLTESRDRVRAAVVFPVKWVCSAWGPAAGSPRRGQHAEGAQEGEVVLIALLRCSFLRIAMGAAFTSVE